MIKKVGDKFVLYSKSKKGGHRKRLGTYSSRAGAMKREKQIQYFKHLKEMTAAAGGSIVGGGSKSFKEKTKNLEVSPFSAIVQKGKGTNKKKAPKMAKLDEEILREAIRKIIFYSKVQYFEQEGKKTLQEQKLRQVIRYLLSEKAEPTPFKSTGLNTAAEVLQRIRRTIADNYKSLTTSEDQRKNFIDTVETLVKQAIDQQDSMKDIESGNTAGAPVAGTEELEEAEGDEASVEQPISAEPQKTPEQQTKDTIKQITADITSSKVDTTGGSKAMPVISTIVPQILTARDTLKDDNDIKSFDLAILGGNGKIGNIKAFANIAEKELQATLGQQAGGSLSDELSSDASGSPASADIGGEETPAESPEVGAETAPEGGEETPETETPETETPA